MKRIRVAGVLCCMALVACGGSGDEDATTGSSPPPTPTPASVAATLPGTPAPQTTVPPTTTAAPATTEAPPKTTTSTSRAPTTTTSKPPQQTEKQRGDPAVYRPDNDPVASDNGSTQAQAPAQAGEIHIPQIGLHKVMFDWDATEGLDELDWGPGLWRGLGEPGQTGNAVIGAHRTSRNAEFRHIDALEPGDEFTVVDRNGNPFVYVVNRSEIVYPDATWVLQQPADASQVTLFACHPLGSTEQRIIVFADLKMP